MKRTYHLAAKSGKKEEKRKHDSGKLSDGDTIDLMIIILYDKQMCLLLIPAYFRLIICYMKY